MRADALLRQVRKIRDEVERAERAECDRRNPAPGPGVAGLIAWARETDRPNRTIEEIEADIDLLGPWPERGIRRLLFETVAHRQQRQWERDLAAEAKG